MTHVSEKYQYERKPCERKDWLYEKYWGSQLSMVEIAEIAGTSREKIRRELERNGIPKRHSHGGRGRISPVVGFYFADEDPPNGDHVLTEQHDDADWVKSRKLRRGQNREQSLPKPADAYK